MAPRPCKGHRRPNVANTWSTREGAQLKGGGAIDLGQLCCKCAAPQYCIELYGDECIARENPAIHLSPR
eukprot:2604635-Pyramimonas_sp.AAC.1